LGTLNMILCSVSVCLSVDVCWCVCRDTLASSPTLTGLQTASSFRAILATMNCSTVSCHVSYSLLLSSLQHHRREARHRTITLQLPQPNTQCFKPRLVTHFSLRRDLTTLHHCYPHILRSPDSCRKQ